MRKLMLVGLVICLLIPSCKNLYDNTESIESNYYDYLFDYDYLYENGGIKWDDILQSSGNKSNETWESEIDKFVFENDTFFYYKYKNNSEPDLTGKFGFTLSGFFYCETIEGNLHSFVIYTKYCYEGIDIIHLGKNKEVKFNIIRR
jgi:hypothetical protein